MSGARSDVASIPANATVAIASASQEVLIDGCREQLDVLREQIGVEGDGERPTTMMRELEHDVGERQQRSAGRWRT